MNVAADQARVLLNLNHARMAEFESSIAKLQRQNELLVRELASRATKDNDKYDSLRVEFNKKLRYLEDDIESRDKEVRQLREMLDGKDSEISRLEAELQDVQGLLSQTREEMTKENAALRSASDAMREKMKRDAVVFQQKLEKTYRRRMEELALKTAQEAYIRRSFEKSFH